MYTERDEITITDVHDAFVVITEVVLELNQRVTGLVGKLDKFISEIEADKRQRAQDETDWQVVRARRLAEVQTECEAWLQRVQEV